MTVLPVILTVVYCINRISCYIDSNLLYWQNCLLYWPQWILYWLYWLLRWSQCLPLHWLHNYIDSSVRFWLLSVTLTAVGVADLAWYAYSICTCFVLGFGSLVSDAIYCYRTLPLHTLYMIKALSSFLPTWRNQSQHLFTCLYTFVIL